MAIKDLIEGKGIDYLPMTSQPFQKAKKHKPGEPEQLVIKGDNDESRAYDGVRTQKGRVSIDSDFIEQNEALPARLKKR